MSALRNSNVACLCGFFPPMSNLRKYFISCLYTFNFHVACRIRPVHTEEIVKDYSQRQVKIVKSKEQSLENPLKIAIFKESYSD